MLVTPLSGAWLEAVFRVEVDADRESFLEEEAIGGWGSRIADGDGILMFSIPSQAAVASVLSVCEQTWNWAQYYTNSVQGGLRDEEINEKEKRKKKFFFGSQKKQKMAVRRTKDGEVRGAFLSLFFSFLFLFNWQRSSQRWRR